jgi:hypothetical protein
MTWGYSNCPFALALPTERTEAILHGMVEAFAFFGCVAHEVWWDNPKTVAPQLFVGRERRLNDRYLALSSHYAFEPLFCMVRRPQEKPHVEGRVRHLQRDWATPVPRVQDRAELNAHLRACCLRDRERTQQGQSETIGQRFARESNNALALGAGSFDPCIPEPAKVDKYQMVRFDANRYSVPRSAAFQAVTVKAYVERLDVVLGSQLIASHPRWTRCGAARPPSTMPTFFAAGICPPCSTNCVQRWRSSTGSTAALSISSASCICWTNTRSNSSSAPSR